MKRGRGQGRLGLERPRVDLTAIEEAAADMAAEFVAGRRSEVLDAIEHMTPALAGVRCCHIMRALIQNHAFEQFEMFSLALQERADRAQPVIRMSVFTADGETLAAVTDWPGFVKVNSLDDAIAGWMWMEIGRNGFARFGGGAGPIQIVRLYRYGDEHRVMRPDCVVVPAPAG